VHAHRFQRQHREEQVRLVADDGAEQPSPAAGLLRGERERPDADVRVFAELVGVGVMAVVLAGPPAIAQPDQQVAMHQPGDVVGPPGPEDPLMAGLVPEEADLAKQGRQVHRDQQLEPGIAEQCEQRATQGQQQRQHSDLDRVVAGPPVQQAGGEVARTEFAECGAQAAGGRGHIVGQPHYLHGLIIAWPVSRIAAAT
jgi:hypothetical protein